MTSEEVTKSKDPKLLSSRVFIGSLPSDRTSREELEEKFAQYGNILGISIHQGFAFVQYDDDRAAAAAVEAEQGCYFKGKKLDLRIASEGRKPLPPRGIPPMKRPHDDYNMPRFDDPAFRGRAPPAPWEREPFGPDHMAGRGSEPFRDDPFWRDRYGPPTVPPGPPGGPPMDSFHGPQPPKRVEYGVERPFDSVIIAVNKHLKAYAEMVERKLIELSMTVDVIFLVHDDALLKAIDDMTRRGILYVLIVQPQHEERKSITVNIMHGTPQEHRNMPLDDALMMLARNFKTYLSSLRSGSEQPSMGFLLNLLADGKHLSVAELDRIIAHLQDRRDRMIEAEGGKVIAREIAPAPANPAEQIQQRIMSILGTGGNAGGAALPSSAPTNTPVFASIAQQLGLSLNPSASIGSAAPTAPPVPGKADQLDKGGLPGGSGSNLSKNLDTLLQNPALLKTLVPQAGVMQANRPGVVPSSAHPFPMGGGLPPPPGKPLGQLGDPEMGIGVRPPQPPPMPGNRGGPGPGY